MRSIRPNLCALHLEIAISPNSARANLRFMFIDETLVIDLSSNDSIESPTDDQKTKLLVASPVGGQLHEHAYYQRAFNSILGSVLEVYKDILSDDETRMYSKILCDLDNHTQRLFIRLFMRKAGWHRVNKLDYDDIPQLHKALAQLQAMSLATEDSDSILDYLDLLTMTEMKQIAQQLLVKTSGVTTRDALQSLILRAKESAQQRLCFSKTGTLAASTPKTSKLDMLRAKLGRIVRMNDGVRAQIETAVSLYFLVSATGAGEANMSTAILVELNRRVYPKYTVRRSRPIFATRQHYADYQTALQREAELLETMELDVAQLAELKDKLVVAVQTCRPDESYFLRRYTAGWVYCRMLSAVAANCETLKQYDCAVNLYETLLRQDVFCLGHRGRWWERSVLDWEKHLDNAPRALEACEAALSDRWVRSASLTALRRRRQKLRKHVTGETTDAPPVQDSPEEVVMYGRIQSGASGRKLQLHIHGDDLSLGSVEEFVLEEFRRRGWDGIHSESSCFATLFALLFWDLLFETEVADVFQTAYQIAPLDLTTDAFYPSRMQAIEDRLQLIAERLHDATELLRLHHRRHHQVSCVGVSWNEYGGDAGIVLLVRVATGIGGMALALIMRQFCEDYRHNRAGMPDLILWRVDEKEGDGVRGVGSPDDWIAHSNGLIFAEVKSPNDRVSDGQRHWFAVLRDAGMRVIVVRVLDQDTTRKRSKTSASSLNSSD